ncbi:MAG: methyltransferase domain-containing protein [Planctomycetota bacterium]
MCAEAARRRVDIEAHRTHLATQIARLTATGSTPIALFGAGQFVRALQPRLLDPDGAIACLVDEDPRKVGRQWAGLPVINVDDALGRGLRGLIITAEAAAQDALWERRRTFLEQGVRVLCCPDRFETLPWDACLVDFYDHLVAQQHGKKIPYLHSYPEPNVVASPRIVALAGRHAGDVICEIGPGAGLWTAELIEHADRYHAVDFSARLLHEVIEHRFHGSLSKLHLHHDTRAQLAEIEDGSVDLVFSFDVFVHLKPDLVHQFLAAIKRVLRPDGNALLHFREWNEAEIIRWHEHFAPSFIGEGTMMHYNTMESLAASAAHIGLRVERIEEDLCYGYFARFEHA